MRYENKIPPQHEAERAGQLQRQIDQARKDGAERRKRDLAAVVQLAKAREQLLALSILLYDMARTEELAGKYELVDTLHEIARMARDIRANQTVEKLREVT